MSEFDPEKVGTSSKRRRKIEEKIASLSKETWFSNLNVFKGKLIVPKVIGEVVKELKEKLNFQQWTHLFLCLLPVVHEKEVCEF